MKMKKMALITAPIALCLLGSLVAINGCGHYVYPIGGHDGGNRDNPPDIRMTVGEEQVAVRANLPLRTAVRLGITWRIGIPSMSSSDASVVEVHQPSKDTVILRAKSPGRALLKYHPCPVEPSGRRRRSCEGPVPTGRMPSPPVPWENSPKTGQAGAGGSVGHVEGPAAGRGS